MLMEQTVYITKNYSPEAVLNTLGEKVKKKEALDLQRLPGGGLYWTRTSDPIDVNDVLYQLSQQTIHFP